MSDFDEEREANIARNRALLAQLDLASGLDIPPPKASEKGKAKPIQPRKRAPKKDTTPPPPRETRQSARLKRPAEDPNESPAKKRKRENEEKEVREREEKERRAAEQRSREAMRPRHQDLDLATLTQDAEDADLVDLTSIMLNAYHPRHGPSDPEAFDFDDEAEQREVEELRNQLKDLKVVARAKVTENRVYSAAYHPEVTKDLILFGDKHGQLGIWDARASVEEAADEDGDVTPSGDQEGGKYWRLQPHWPASSKSSISGIIIDPTDSHMVYTSAYDCTVRRLSFSSGISREIFSLEDILICSMDLTPTGHEMWVSDAAGGVTHLDLREDKSKARWYQLSDQKIGSVSVNPAEPRFILTASNSRVLKTWDTRKLSSLEAPSIGPLDFDSSVIQEFIDSTEGEGCQRSEWKHGKSVSLAYWDPRGRGIVSTSYDDTIRLWDVKPSFLKKDAPFPTFRPMAQIKHNCQTGKWLTILKARWNPNPNVYPHFTIANMNHALDVVSCKGDLLARLLDPNRITAVQAVTCSHPSIIQRAATGNASGRCVLWAPSEEDSS